MIALTVQSVDIFADLISWDEECVQLPLNAHKKHTVLLVDILIKVDDISFVVSNKLCNLRYDARLILTV